MAAKLKTPVIKEFTLVKTDEDHGNTGDPTRIRVRQATTGDLRLRNDYFSTFEQHQDEEGNVITQQELSVETVRQKEVFLTLSYCNYEDETGAPLFHFEDGRLRDEAALNKAWDKLPVVVSDEIIEFTLEVNPQWTNRGNKKSPTT